MEAKQLVHELYNDLTKSGRSDVKEIQEVLLKVYTKLDASNNPVRLINRLTNFIYFTAFTEKLKFSEQQNKWIAQLSEIGGKAGVNATHRGAVGSKFQF
ncbi:bacteriocin immunity protein [Enterococcus olivae]